MSNVHVVAPLETALDDYRAYLELAEISDIAELTGLLASSTTPERFVAPPMGLVI
jgi:hypothetical protein